MNQQVSRRGAVLAAVLAMLPVVPVAADSERGRLLYENHCTKCHTSNVHVRTDHKAKSVADIRFQVARWSQELKLGWDKQEIDEVVGYLSGTFYRFGAERPVK